jgi:hypothetical protein
MWIKIKHFFKGHNFYDFIIIQHGEFKNENNTTSGDCKIKICDCGKVEGELKLHPVRRLQTKSAFERLLT